MDARRGHKKRKMGAPTNPHLVCPRLYKYNMLYLWSQDKLLKNFCQVFFLKLLKQLETAYIRGEIRIRTVPQALHSHPLRSFDIGPQVINE